MLGRLSPFTHLVYRVCVISQFSLFQHWRELESNCHRKKRKRKKKPHKSVRAAEVGTLQDLAEILIRGQRRGGRGGRGGGGGSVVFRLKMRFGSCSVHQVYFLHGCSGKNVSPLKSLKNSASFFFLGRFAFDPKCSYSVIRHSLCLNADHR